MMHSYSEIKEEPHRTRCVLILVVMDDALVPCVRCHKDNKLLVLILVVMDDALVLVVFLKHYLIQPVLILVVMDDALVPNIKTIINHDSSRLNPCCNG